MKMYGTITFTGAFIEILGVDLEKNSFLPRLIWKVTPAEWARMQGNPYNVISKIGEEWNVREAWGPS